MTRLLRAGAVAAAFLTLGNAPSPPQEGGVTAPPADIRASLHALSLAQPQSVGAWRWHLAGQYAARRNWQEAAGVLAVIAADDAERASTHHFRRAYARALLETGRAAEALRLVKGAVFDGDPAACDLRTRALGKLGRHSEVLRQPRCGTHGADLARLRAAVQTNTWDEADRLAGALPATSGSAAAAELDYWRGRAAAAHGDNALARRHYRSAEESGHPVAAQLAAAYRADLDHRSGLIFSPQALSRLEEFRFRWRGGAAEAAILFRIAYHAHAAGESGTALEALSELARYGRGKAKMRAAAAARQLFADYMQEDGGPAEDRFALFWAGRDFVPAGPAGDRLVSQLAGDLEQLGLYRQAAHLLDHQMRNRLHGRAQVEAAISLAALERRAGRPAAALEAVLFVSDEARAALLLPQLRRAEAAALVQMGRNSEAEAALTGDGGRAAQLLREEIAWQTRNWQRLAALFEANPPAASAADGQSRRRVWRQAVAAHMIGSRTYSAALAARYSQLFKGGADQTAFQALTSGLDGSDGDLLRAAVARAAAQASSASSRS